MTLEQQYEKFLEQGFDPNKEVLAYSEGIKNENGAFLVDPIKSTRGDGENTFTLRRFPKNDSVKYLSSNGFKLWTPPTVKKATPKSTSKAKA